MKVKVNLIFARSKEGRILTDIPYYIEGERCRIFDIVKYGTLIVDKAGDRMMKDHHVEHTFILSGMARFEEVLEEAKQDGLDIYILGGVEICEKAYPHADRIYVTDMDMHVDTGKPFIHDFDQDGFRYAYKPELVDGRIPGMRFIYERAPKEAMGLAGLHVNLMAACSVNGMFTDLLSVSGEEDYVRLMTLGHKVVMDRETFEKSHHLFANSFVYAIGWDGASSSRYKPVPALEDALREAAKDSTLDVFVIGNEALTKEAVSYAYRIYLTKAAMYLEPSHGHDKILFNTDDGRFDKVRLAVPVDGAPRTRTIFERRRL